MNDRTRQRNIEYFKTVDSTNTVLKKRIADGLINGEEISAAVAEEQTNGRGRRGRVWLNTDGALMMSICAHIKDPKTAPLASIAAAIAALETIRPYCETAMIKWPNDVVAVSGAAMRKLCGILSELVVSPDGNWFAVLGTGINTNCSEVPHDLLQPASSIFMETEKQTDIKALSEALFDNTSVFIRMLSQDPGELLHRYAINCVTLGKTVKISFPDGIDVLGFAESIDDLGRLVVNIDGESRTVSAADVSVKTL